MKRTKLKRKTRLRPVSKKRGKQMREYSTLRKQYMAQHPKCEVCRTCPSKDIHHKQGRYHDRLNDSTHWMAVCRECHDAIHALPQWAYSQGFLLRR